MVTWDDAIQNCKDLASDNSTTAATFFQRMMNVGYKIVLSGFNRPNIERTITASTRGASNPLIKNDRKYMLPVDALWPKSIVLTIGSQDYPIIEEESQEMWDYRTRTLVSGIPTTYFIAPRWGIGGCEVLLDPIPSASGSTLTIVYEASDKDLSQTAYTTGSTTVANNSAAVTSSGATFTTGMIGRYWKSTDATSDGMWYRIVDVPSSSTLTLENVYQGSINQSAVGYTINEAFNLPDDMMQMLPVYFALQHWFALKKDAANEVKYMKYVTDGLEDARERWATKTRSNVVRGKHVTRWPNSYPMNFPGSGISS